MRIRSQERWVWVFLSQRELSHERHLTNTIVKFRAQRQFETLVWKLVKKCTAEIAWIAVLKFFCFLQNKQLEKGASRIDLNWVMQSHPPHHEPDVQLEGKLMNFLVIFIIAEKDPYPVDALPTCNHALSVCQQERKCIKLFEDFKTHCKVRENKCRMEDR